MLEMAGQAGRNPPATTVERRRTVAAYADRACERQRAGGDDTLEGSSGQGGQISTTCNTPILSARRQAFFYWSCANFCTRKAASESWVAACRSRLSAAPHFGELDSGGIWP